MQPANLKEEETSGIVTAATRRQMENNAFSRTIISTGRTERGQESSGGLTAAYLNILADMRKRGNPRLA